MAGTSLEVVRRVRAILGADSVVDTDATGTPRVAPTTEETISLVLQTAATEGWRVLVAGGQSWTPADADADLILCTTGLNRIVDVAPGDLVATVEAGVRWTDLRRTLADAGSWVASDPPGVGRTLGSVVATATAGPLRTGLGSVREHLLGLTLVTGEGRVVRAGGRVMKNVAGFDLTRMAAGSFGAFGVVTLVHLRLRSVPRADRTVLISAERDEAVQAGLAVLAAGITPAALELVSPGAGRRQRWTLAIRMMGSDEAVDAEYRAVAAAADQPVEDLSAAPARGFWATVTESCTEQPVALRLGTVPAALEEALDLLAHQLDDTWVTASIGAAALRWSGQASPERLRLLRHAAAQREMPVTLERAPASVRERVGVFGAYREGVATLVDNLRRSFDPAGVLVVPLTALE